MDFVTDRTQADVLLHTKKGFYNTEDLNRVESNTKKLYEIAASYGIKVSGDATFKTDWHLTDTFDTAEWVTETQMKRYLGNVARLVKAVNATGLVTLPESMAHLDYNGANDIEKALEVSEKLLRNIKAGWLYCGAYECGGI